jgi:integrase
VERARAEAWYRSRRRWAPGHSWSFKHTALQKLLAWAQHHGSVTIITPRQIATGEGFKKLPPGVILAYPGQNNIERWIEHLVQQKVKACVVLPDWHGPAMSAVEQAQMARMHLGPAYGIFNAAGGKEIPGWPMVATLVNFGDRATDAIPLAGQADSGHDNPAAATHTECGTTFAQQFIARVRSISAMSDGTATTHEHPANTMAHRGMPQAIATTAATRPDVNITPAATRQEHPPGCAVATATPDAASWLAQFAWHLRSTRPSGAPGMSATARQNTTGANRPLDSPGAVHKRVTWRNGRRIWIGGAPANPAPNADRSSWLAQFAHTCQQYGPSASRRGQSAGHPQHQQNWILQPSDWSRATRPDTSGFTDEQLLHHARQLQQWSRAPATRKNYLHWWRVFAEFCEKRGWVQTAALIPIPVPVDNILRWVAWLSSKYAASTINISLAAIATIHKDEGLPSPTTDSRVKAAVEGAARTGPYNVKEEAVVITPVHVRHFMSLGSVTPDKGSPWSTARRLRAVAMVCIGFGGFLRRSEIHELDICDIHRDKDATIVSVKRAKMDQVGRGRSTIIGAAVGDAADAEQSIWSWVSHADLQVSPRCTKRDQPQERCTQCGPLFPRLTPTGTTKKNMGKARITEELRELLRECKRVGRLPSDFNENRVSAISLRRGGNSAAAAAGIAGIVRASHGRWKSEAVPNNNYTFMHRTEMVQLATALYKRRP